MPKTHEILITKNITKFDERASEREGERMQEGKKSNKKMSQDGKTKTNGSNTLYFFYKDNFIRTMSLRFGQKLRTI